MAALLLLVIEISLKTPWKPPSLIKYFNTQYWKGRNLLFECHLFHHLYPFPNGKAQDDGDEQLVKQITKVPIEINVVPSTSIIEKINHIEVDQDTNSLFLQNEGKWICQHENDLPNFSSNPNLLIPFILCFKVKICFLTEKVEVCYDSLK